MDLTTLGRRLWAEGAEANVGLSKLLLGSPLSPSLAEEDRGVGVVGDRGGDHLLDGRGGLVDDRVESVVVIGGVVDGAHRTIGLHQRVLSLHDITVALLGLRLDVTGVRVLDAVVERVLRVGLNNGTDSLHIKPPRTRAQTIKHKREASVARLRKDRSKDRDTYHRLGNDVLQHRSGMDRDRGMDQSGGTIVAVFDRRRTDGNGEQSNGNEALQGKQKRFFSTLFFAGGAARAIAVSPVVMLRPMLPVRCADIDRGFATWLAVQQSEMVLFLEVDAKTVARKEEEKIKHDHGNVESVRVQFAQVTNHCCHEVFTAASDHN
uniref:Uncharacterized protein n=1 Tax=Anopheles farauti TaxID=69004 RepID=A0A182Q087_9DIPT